MIYSMLASKPQSLLFLATTKQSIYLRNLSFYTLFVKKFPISNEQKFSVSNSNKLFSDTNIFTRRLLTTESMTPKESGDKKKPPSKFKQFYSQYGPMFLVVHLTTVVMWIYGFFLISKQGYDITQLLNLFEKINFMSGSTVMAIHEKIDNYKTESGWITGPNIKHFATAYMVYKVIAPFRYVVSIAICRSLVRALRAKGIMKS